MMDGGNSRGGAVRRRWPGGGWPALIRPAATYPVSRFLLPRPNLMRGGAARRTRVFAISKFAFRFALEAAE